MRSTGESLDLGLDGEGFFIVNTPAGPRFTRAGQFAMNAQGVLVTLGGGFAVLDEAGGQISIPEIVRANPNLERVSVSASGLVTVDDAPVGSIGVVAVADAAKEGENLYTGTAGTRPPATSVRQGFLEGSSVEPARAMLDMIVSLRAYEASQRVLRVIDESLGRAIAAGAVNR